MSKCLIVVDEIELTKMTEEYFELFGIDCDSVYDYGSCVDYLKKTTPDIILMDVNLGDKSGFELCRKIREESDIPILFISARRSDDDVLIALNIGGDDYIKKPYSLSVLLAKVKAMLRRVEGSSGNSEKQTSKSESEAHGKYLFEKETMSFIKNGKKIPLKAREFALLKYLYDNRNRIVTKDEIFREVWGDSFYSDGTLNVHIRRVREKIEDDPNEPGLIKTIWGTGYMMEIPEE